MLSVAIAAGGTGGHIYPGLALAAALRQAEPDVRIAFVGTRRGLEGRLVPEAGYTLHLVDMVPFVGAKRLVLPAALLRSSWQSRRILKRADADVAVSMGGYAGIPLVAGARLVRVPSLIHESGAVPGRANKLAARITTNVATAFEAANPHFPASVTARTVGMPLSAEVTAFDRDTTRVEARRTFGLDDDRTALVLVNGGSQGSARLNDAAVGLAQRWRARDDVRILVKAGRNHADDLARRLEETGGDAVASSVAYFDRMVDAYAAADLTLCRAGAGTVAELAVVGLPAILVPYPFAPDDHQAVNASTLVEAGAALMVRDHDADAARLGPMIEDLLAHRDKLGAMAAAARHAARPRATHDLAAWVLELAAPR